MQKAKKKKTKERSNKALNDSLLCNQRARAGQLDTSLFSNRQIRFVCSCIGNTDHADGTTNDCSNHLHC
jgi:hypothetical protein